MVEFNPTDPLESELDFPLRNRSLLFERDFETFTVHGPNSETRTTVHNSTAKETACVYGQNLFYDALFTRGVATDVRHSQPYLKTIVIST